MKQHFFLRDKWLGSRDIPTHSECHDHRMKVSDSYALFCPNCAEIWGKIMHDAAGAYCQVVTSRCPDHAAFPSDGTYSIPGDSRYPDSRADLATMPKDVQVFDIASLSNFYLNHPEKWYWS